MRTEAVVPVPSKSISRLSIYHVMFFDALIGSALFGVATMWGRVSLESAVGGLMFWGALSIGTFTFAHWRGLEAEEDVARDPARVIAHLGEVLRSSAPGDPVVSGILVALDLAYWLGEVPPKSHEAMLERLNYGRFLIAYGPNIGIDGSDVENAQRYYKALCVRYGIRPQQVEDEDKARESQAMTA